MFINKHFINTGTHISKSKRCYNVKPSACYFYMRTNIPLNFRICIDVPLRLIWLKYEFGKITLEEINCCYKKSH